MFKTLFLAQLASTLYLTGLIWMVQVVHYPLFDRVDRSAFAAFEADHSRLISWIVLPPMLVELATAGWLVWQRPEELPGWSAWLGLGLVLAIWLSTFLLQVPQHDQLARGYDEAAHRFLVVSNLLRTGAWTARGGLVLWMASRLMK